MAIRFEEVFHPSDAIILPILRPQNSDSVAEESQWQRSYTVSDQVLRDTLYTFLILLVFYYPKPYSKNTIKKGEENQYFKPHVQIIFSSFLMFTRDEFMVLNWDCALGPRRQGGGLSSSLEEKFNLEGGT